MQFDGLRLYKYDCRHNIKGSQSLWHITQPMAQQLEFFRDYIFSRKNAVYKIERLWTMVLGLNLVVNFRLEQVSSDGLPLCQKAAVLSQSHTEMRFRGHLDPLVLFDIFVRSQS